MSEYRHIEKLLKLGCLELDASLKSNVHVKTGALRNSIKSKSFKDDKIITSFLDYGKLNKNWGTPYIITIEDFAGDLAVKLEAAYAKDIVDIVKNYTKKYNKIKAK